ncbi:hypothetical protein OG234_32970 [Streptomyces sp. NBC_01420]|uniref:DoxX family protein n=1 Tax=Streptomyces sp. NBC_01420 TaxID=2903858 RepID=UPI00324CFF48
MFESLMLLAVPTLVFRLLGALGVRRFASWRAALVHGLAGLFVASGAAHFVPDGGGVMPSHDDLTAMVPPFVPLPHLVVYGTGALELLGAAGLVRAATRPVAGICLAVLLVLMLPANVYAALEDVPLDGDPATPLWFRIPEQAVYIAVALLAAGEGDGARRPGHRARAGVSRG